ncbi:ribosomal RNA-processing protein 15 [Monosporozyma servazzii]
MSSKGKLTLSKVGKENAKKRSRDEATGSNSDSGLEELSHSENENMEADELDLADVSSADEDENAKSSDQNNSEQEDTAEVSDDDFPKKRKSKKSKHDDGSKEFSSAVSAILSSHLKAYDRKDPIMARNKKVLKQNDADKLEAKAKKAMTTEKKKLLDKVRKRDILPRATDDSGEDIRTILEKESKLRKIAQKGVVKLFNAILSTQVKTDKEVSEQLGDVRNKQEREQLITEVSKEKFLDLVKAAATEE